PQAGRASPAGGCGPAPRRGRARVNVAARRLGGARTQRAAAPPLGGARGGAMGPEAGRTAGGGAAPLVRLALGGALLAAAAEGGGPLELMSAYTVVHFKRRHRQAPADKGGGVSGRVDEMVREMCRTRPDHPQCVAYARAEA
ncbi:unnamed protein product, partial [Prorocentrum cordatum]